jgi:hypothetical protein
MRAATALSRHAAAEAASLPRLEASLSDLVGYGEMGFSGRLPTGKASAEIAALMTELRNAGWLPLRASRAMASNRKPSGVNTSSRNTNDSLTHDVKKRAAR